jgi:copper chaperone
MTEKTYSVPDISCMHCKRAIEGAVGAMPGISRVEVDVDGKTVHVVFEQDTVAEADVLAALAEEGYPVAR